LAVLTIYADTFRLHGLRADELLVSRDVFSFLIEAFGATPDVLAQILGEQGAGDGASFSFVSDGATIDMRVEPKLVRGEFVIRDSKAWAKAGSSSSLDNIPFCQFRGMFGLPKHAPDLEAN